MSNDNDKTVAYRSYKDIFCRHGLIVVFFYWVFWFSKFITPTGWWLILGEISPRTRRTIDHKKYRSEAWWQDVGVILHILATFSIVTLYPYAPLWYMILAWYWIADMVAYHAKVLWFDDLIPSRQSAEARGVLSHRRILFQGLINFTESIFLFGVLYINYCDTPGCKTQIYRASFEVATTLSRSNDLPSWPSWLIIMQVCISIFFLVVVISTVASVAYKREELAEKRKSRS